MFKASTTDLSTFVVPKFWINVFKFESLSWNSFTISVRLSNATGSRLDAMLFTFLSRSARASDVAFVFKTVSKSAMSVCRLLTSDWVTLDVFCNTFRSDCAALLWTVVVKFVTLFVNELRSDCEAFDESSNDNSL